MHQAHAHFIYLLILSAAKGQIDKTFNPIESCGTRPVPVCPHSFFYSTIFDQCYSLPLVHSIYSFVHTYCSDKGGHLIKIESREKNEFIVNASVTPYAKSQFWMGLQFDSQRGKYVWTSDGTELDPKRDYFNFTFVPGSRGPRASCVTILSSGQWSEQRCTAKANAFCQTDSLALPDGRPTFHLEKNNTVFIPGDTIKAYCESNLRIKGEMRFILFSDSEIKASFGTSDSTVTYTEGEVSVDSKLTCTRQARGILSLTATVAMDDKMIGCVVAQVPAASRVQRCSQHDPYCALHGPLKVEDLWNWWWLLAVLIALMVIVLVLARTCTRKQSAVLVQKEEGDEYFSTNEEQKENTVPLDTAGPPAPPPLITTTPPSKATKPTAPPSKEVSVASGIKTPTVLSQSSQRTKSTAR